nr:Uncharacterised protein [Ipomoea batatas]
MQTTSKRTRVTTDLSSVLDATVGYPERMHSPVQVESLLGLSKRQTLSQSSLIDLDSTNASLLQIFYLILDSQCNLITSFKPKQREPENLVKMCCEMRRGMSKAHIIKVTPRLVISDEGPIQNGNRAIKAKPDNCSPKYSTISFRCITRKFPSVKRSASLLCPLTEIKLHKQRNSSPLALHAPKHQCLALPEVSLLR